MIVENAQNCKSKWMYFGKYDNIIVSLGKISESSNRVTRSEKLGKVYFENRWMYG